jgi:FAD binding domain
MMAGADQVATLVAELRRDLGPDAVTTDSDARARASEDGARMSPILAAQLPLGLADAVAFPGDAEQIAAVVLAAVRLGVPVTPRGKGTGNYGQAIPMRGGLVIDTSRARAVVEITDDHITAEAGATLIRLEQAARETGRQIWMYPSTAHSTIGGFLAGGWAGTGTIAHGAIHEGFVTSLDIVHADGTGLRHVSGPDADPYLHAYGTTGLIARASVRVEPAQQWCAVLATFPTHRSALTPMRELGRATPSPRLVSADPAEIAATLPPDDAIDPALASLRAIVDLPAVDAARVLIESAGGRVNTVRHSPQASVRLSTISYNHPIVWLQKSRPQPYFHLEVNGDALVDRLDEVQAIYPGGLLHAEAGHRMPTGMLAAPFHSAEAVHHGVPALNALGVGVHMPHQWYVDFELARAVEHAARNDPAGLLNPGKLDPCYAGPQKGATVPR